MRTKHYSLRTEKAYWYWFRYFIRFHRLRYPRDMAEPEAAQFLTWLATNRNVAAATQNQALNALVFLCKQVLQQPLQQIDGISRTKKPRKLPVVLSHQEAMLVISKLPSLHRLIASLISLYVSEACHLRIQDVDFSLHRLLIRNSKGGKDRTTLLPWTLFTELQGLIVQQTRHHASQHITPAPVSLPYALLWKYPNAGSALAWQWLFPSNSLCQEDNGYATIHMSLLYRKRLNEPSQKPVYTRRLHTTAFGTVLQLSYCIKVPISAPYKSCLDTPI